jgi:hypothetical protein
MNMLGVPKYTVNSRVEVAGQRLDIGCRTARNKTRPCASEAEQQEWSKIQRRRTWFPRPAKGKQVAGANYAKLLICPFLIFKK